VGYLAWECVRHFEPRVPIRPEDPLGVPEALFLFVDTLLVFDHLRHVVKVVSHCRLDGEVEASYRQACWRIEELVERLSRRIQMLQHVEEDDDIEESGRIRSFGERAREDDHPRLLPRHGTRPRIGFDTVGLESGASGQLQERPICAADLQESSRCDEALHPSQALEHHALSNGRFARLDDLVHQLESSHAFGQAARALRIEVREGEILPSLSHIYEATLPTTHERSIQSFALQKESHLRSTAQIAGQVRHTIRTGIWEPASSDALQISALDVADLLDAAPMSLLGQMMSEPHENDLPCPRFIERARTERQDVGVIMLAAVPGRGAVVTQGGTHARQLIGNDARSDARAVQEDAARDLPARDGSRDAIRDVGIIHRLLIEGPEIAHLVPQLD
jgi:hypothetical protein